MTLNNQNLKIDLQAAKEALEKVFKRYANNDLIESGPGGRCVVQPFFNGTVNHKTHLMIIY